MKIVTHIPICLLLVAFSMGDFARFWVFAPSVWVHYQEHKLEDPHTDFNTFLVEHGAGNHLHDSDHDHDHFPFQSQTAIDFQFIKLIKNQEFNAFLLLQDSSIQPFVIRIQGVERHLGMGIWQPPKV